MKQLLSLFPDSSLTEPNSSEDSIKCLEESAVPRTVEGNNALVCLDFSFPRMIVSSLLSVEYPVGVPKDQSHLSFLLD